MKYLLLIITFLLAYISFFSISSDVSAGFFSDLADYGREHIPYCKNHPCGLEEGIGQIKPVDIIETTRTASQYIQDIVVYLLGFLMLLSVLIIIYSGLVLLTSLGNEEKVKKTKKIILYAILGLIIIFLAYPITDFVFKVLNS